jgi:hypothetical protein
MAVKAIVLTFRKGAEAKQTTTTELAEFLCSEVEVNFVFSIEEYKEAVEHGDFSHTYMEWGHVPEMQLLREWAKGCGLEVLKAKYQDRREPFKWRGASGYQTVTRRCGLQTV